MSYVFGLIGPSMSIDTACSSSLVAAHYGTLDIQSGISSAALAAGISLTLGPRKTAAFAITGEAA